MSSAELFRLSRPPSKGQAYQDSVHQANAGDVAVLMHCSDLMQVRCC